MMMFSSVLRGVTAAVVLGFVVSEGCAQIQIKDGSRTVANGGIISLGSVVQKAAAPLKIVTIRNTAKTAVNLGLAASVDQNASFEVVSNYATNQIVQGGQSYSITVRLKNAGAGYKTGTLMVAGQRINIFGAVTVGAIIVDDLDPGFSTTGTWPTQSPGYGGRQVRTPGGGQQTSTATASWRFDGLKPGQYDVGVTWGGGSKALASNAQYIIRDGGSSGIVVASAAANQWYVPSSNFPGIGGQPFQKLATVTIKSNTLVVTVSNIGNFSSVDIAADAMLVMPK